MIHSSSRMTASDIESIMYTPWVAGTHPLNTFFSYNGTIVMVNNPAGTSSTPPASSNANWLVFADQAAVSKYFADLLS